MRALPATRTAEIAARVCQTGVAPGVNPLFPRVAADQTMAQRERGFWPLAFIARAHGGAFVVSHQRQIERSRHGALGEFDRRANVE
ncbi:hypothetical protein D3C81_1782760 [compost metagenome]